MASRRHRVRFRVNRASGLLTAARQVPSPNQDARPAGVEPELIVVHSISLPPGEYGGPWIERLFTNRLDPRAHPYFASIAGLRVSAHLLIRRDGALVQFVPFHRRAWHAGESCWQGRACCNDFSIGIELEGLEGRRFEPAQYTALLPLLRGLARRYPLRAVTGHEHVAPGRKHDPGPGFDWVALGQQAGFPERLRIAI